MIAIIVALVLALVAVRMEEAGFGREPEARRRQRLSHDLKHVRWPS